MDEAEARGESDGDTAAELSESVFEVTVRRTAGFCEGAVAVDILAVEASNKLTEVN